MFFKTIISHVQAYFISSSSSLEEHEMPNWAELNEEETLKWLAKDTEPIRVISRFFFEKWEIVRVLKKCFSCSLLLITSS